MVLSMVELSLVDALTLSVAAPAQKIAIQQLGYVGLVLAPTAWLAFVLGYTGILRQSTWRLSALLAFEPAVLFALALTNSSHGLVWQSVVYDSAVAGGGIQLVDGASVPFMETYAYGLWRSRHADSGLEAVP